MGQKLSKRRASMPPPPTTAPLTLSRKTPGTALPAPHDGVLTLIQRGDFAAAERLARQVVEQNKTQLGPNNPLTLINWFQLGKALHGDGRVEKALHTFQELLPLSEMTFGPSNVVTLATLDAIAEELCNMGEHKLSLSFLIQERERCEQSLGKMHKRTIQIQADIANLYILIDNPDKASSAFSLALNSSRKSLGESHDLTLAILNDLRGLKRSQLPNMEEMTALLRQHHLPVSTTPFPNTLSTTWRALTGGFTRIQGITTVGYEASNALYLRIGPLNGKPRAEPPMQIPPYYEDTGKITLGQISGETKVDHSFQSLINRSIEILPRNSNVAIQKAVQKHTAFLKSLQSLDQLLTAKENPVWFFQHRESFLQQTTFQKWDPNSLGRYIVLPMEGGFANQEDCIFISHYWRTPQHPDPEGVDLQHLHQLLFDGFWATSSYFWVDWTCLPQSQRTANQRQYFSRALKSVSRLIRDCSFVAQFPEYESRLWILFEVATYILNRNDAVGFPCTDPFEQHLLQMKGDGVRSVVNKYHYRCTNSGESEWVITCLEILLALYKAVPSLHTRQQIFNAIDNAAVRLCVHQEAGVEVDKERGTIKVNGEVVLQFNPMPVVEGITSLLSYVRIEGDYKSRLGRALKRADQSFDISGLGEMGREYDRVGDYRIGEALHRRHLAARVSVVPYHYLSVNLGNQGRFGEAQELCRRNMALPGASEKLGQQLTTLIQKEADTKVYRKWKTQPLEATIYMGGEQRTAISTDHPRPPIIRAGLRRSWLQRLDQDVWQCEDPIISKSMEERGLQLEEQGRFAQAQATYWALLRRTKTSLGPCHVATRRCVHNLARACKQLGNIENAHLIYKLASVICDFTLGVSHPESRAALGDLAVVVLIRGKLGLARSYYRQQLQRTLAVAKWDDPEMFLPKFFLQALIGNGELRIVQNREATKVDIMTYPPPSTLAPPVVGRDTKPTKPQEQKGDSSSTGQGYLFGLPKGAMILNFENADFLREVTILAT